MSHAMGAIKFESDGEIMYYEYDGTSDMVLSQLHKDSEGVTKNWRKGKHIKCTCGGGESVEIMNTYAGGGYFDVNGKACRKCMAIISPLYCEDFMSIEIDGEPEWSPFKND